MAVKKLSVTPSPASSPIASPSKQKIYETESNWRESFSKRAIVYGLFYSVACVAIWYFPRVLKMMLQEIDGNQYLDWLGYSAAVLGLGYAAGPSPIIIPLAIAACFPFRAKTDLWNYLLDQNNTELMLIYIPAGVSLAGYWINGFLLLLCDVFDHPFMNSKIQKDKKFPTDFKTIKKILLNLLFNQLFVITPAILTVWYLQGNLIHLEFNRELPSGWNIFFQIMFTAMVDELLFYHVHRLMHVKALYGTIHKQHHEFKHPNGLVAAYCHPVEMLFANVIPLFVGPVVSGCHVYVFQIWMLFSVLATQTHHCGYNWPWMKGNEQPGFHDFHHERFVHNFGATGHLDRLHGTRKSYDEREAKVEAEKKKASKKATSPKIF